MQGLGLVEFVFDSWGRRVSVGTWLSPDKNPDNPPIAQVIGFEKGEVLVNTDPSSGCDDIRPLFSNQAKIVRISDLTKTGWVKSSHQPLDTSLR